jgi:hypothetical protein
MPQRNALLDQTPAGTTICLGSLNGIVAQSIHLYQPMPNRQKSLVILAGLGFEEAQSLSSAFLPYGTCGQDCSGLRNGRANTCHELDPTADYCGGSSGVTIRVAEQ